MEVGERACECEDVVVKVNRKGRRGWKGVEETACERGGFGRMVGGGSRRGGGVRGFELTNGKRKISSNL